MPHFSCDPKLQLYGQSTRALIENMNYDVVRPHLAQHGLDDIDPDGWYAMQSILEVFNALLEQGGAMADFVAIGMKAAELSPLPPELEQMTFAQFMQLYAERVYPARHQGGDPGTFAVEHTGPNALHVIIANVYPDDVMYGLVYGFAKRFMGQRGIPFIVEYKPDTPTREQGGEQTVIQVSWED